MLEGDGGTTAWQVDTLLAENTYYWWVVQARDDQGLPSGWSSAAEFFVNTYNDAPTDPSISSPADGEETITLTPWLAAGPWSAAVSFFVNRANDAPGAPDLNNPVSGGTVTSLTPNLSVFNSDDLDQQALRYEFELYADPDLTSPVNAAGVSQQDLITAWRVPSPLTDDGIYYWRARAGDGLLDGSWMPTAVFEVHTAGADTLAEIGTTQAVSARSQTLQTVTVSDPDSPICRTSLDIPPGGLYEDCRITIRVVTNPPALPTRVRAVGRVIEFGPSGRHFAVPLTFRIAYRGADLRRARISQAADLEVFYYDTAALAWQKIEIESIDTQNQLVTFTSDHFSMYALGQSTASETSGDDGGGGGGGGCFIAAAKGSWLGGGWIFTAGLLTLGIMGIIGNYLSPSQPNYGHEMFNR